ncbi:unnamed protein product [Gadus morhua 'NCC']
MLLLEESEPFTARTLQSNALPCAPHPVNTHYHPPSPPPPALPFAVRHPDPRATLTPPAPLSPLTPPGVQHLPFALHPPTPHAYATPTSRRPTHLSHSSPATPIAAGAYILLRATLTAAPTSSTSHLHSQTSPPIPHSSLLSAYIRAPVPRTSHTSFHLATPSHSSSNHAPAHTIHSVPFYLPSYIPAALLTPTFPRPTQTINHSVVLPPIFWHSAPWPRTVPLNPRHNDNSFLRPHETNSISWHTNATFHHHYHPRSRPQTPSTDPHRSNSHSQQHPLPHLLTRIFRAHPQLTHDHYQSARAEATLLLASTPALFTLTRYHRLDPQAAHVNSLRLRHLVLSTPSNQTRRRISSPRRAGPPPRRGHDARGRPTGRARDPAPSTATARATHEPETPDPTHTHDARREHAPHATHDDPQTDERTSHDADEHAEPHARSRQPAPPRPITSPARLQSPPPPPRSQTTRAADTTARDPAAPRRTPANDAAPRRLRSTLRTGRHQERAAPQQPRKPRDSRARPRQPPGPRPAAPATHRCAPPPPAARSHRTACPGRPLFSGPTAHAEQSRTAPTRRRPQTSARAHGRSAESTPPTRLRARTTARPPPIPS